MTTINDYIFNNMSRIGNDNCDKSERNIQNVHQSNLTLTNYFSADCAMQKGMNFALSAPNINYTGTHQVGAGGCNIDINSGLLIDPLSRPPCRISLFERPFLTVPYLGKGNVDPVMESNIQQGDQISHRKTNTEFSEKSYINHQYTPMIASLANSISNPVHSVEGIAAAGWIRGGLPSRDLTKNKVNN